MRENYEISQNFFYGGDELLLNSVMDVSGRKVWSAVFCASNKQKFCEVGEVLHIHSPSSRVHEMAYQRRFSRDGMELQTSCRSTQVSR